VEDIAAAAAAVAGVEQDGRKVSDALVRNDYESSISLNKINRASWDRKRLLNV
jgi:hypothetical protein